MSSKRSREGYLMIDHRNSPGVNDAAAVRAGLPVGAGQGLFESAIVLCNHCQRSIVLNPDRTRERGYCRGCDSYICDICTEVRQKTGECKPFQKVLDEAMTAAEKAAANGSPIILLS